MLSHGHHDNYRFTPDPSWLDSGQIPLLSLRLFQRPEAWRSTHLPVWFENLLPENPSGLRKIVCERFDLRPGQSLALLQVLGSDLPGAVVVSSDSPAGDSPDDPPASDSDDTLHFSSLAGVQLKFSVVRENDRFTLPLRGGPGEWIVKLPEPTRGLLPAVEHATMSWARAAGFDVPETQVVETSSLSGLEAFVERGVEHAFVIRRYDRLPDGRRVHQEDFCQVLNFAPSHKYGDHVGKFATLDLIARIVQQACAPETLAELLERFAFVIAAGNTDAHLKNWSFIYAADSAIPRLTPVYDQVCTIAIDPTLYGWDNRQKGPILWLGLGGEKRFRALGLPHVDRLMERLGDSGPLRQRFIAALERARGAWPAVADLAPPEMHEALEQHWRQVPLLDYLGGWTRS